MADDGGEKSYDPTPRRREQARQQGQFAKSTDLAPAVVFCVALVGLFYFGPGLIETLAGVGTSLWGGQQWRTLRDGGLLPTTGGMLTQAGLATLPVLAAVVVAAVACHVGQTGLVFLPEKLFELKWDRLDPLKGAQRLASLQGLMRLVSGLLKIGLVATVGVVSIVPQMAAIADVAAAPGPAILGLVAEIVFWVTIKVGATLVLLAILDFAWQKWQLEQKLKMSLQELKDEMKESEGDPQVRAVRRAAQRRLAQAKFKQAVPKADVVVTNPTELAVALRYDAATMEAPVVVAKGAGVVAARIRKLALEAGVPIVERKEVARFLFKKVPVGKAVPPEMYRVLAEILRYVYTLKGRAAA